MGRSDHPCCSIRHIKRSRQEKKETDARNEGEELTHERK
jgi:hypothetical protein